MKQPALSLIAGVVWVSFATACERDILGNETTATTRRAPHADTAWGDRSADPDCDVATEFCAAECDPRVAFCPAHDCDPRTAQCPGECDREREDCSATAEIPATQQSTDPGGGSTDGSDSSGATSGPGSDAGDTTNADEASDAGQDDAASNAEDTGQDGASSTDGGNDHDDASQPADANSRGPSGDATGTGTPPANSDNDCDPAAQTCASECNAKVEICFRSCNPWVELCSFECDPRRGACAVSIPSPHDGNATAGGGGTDGTDGGSAEAPPDPPDPSADAKLPPEISGGAGGVDLAPNKISIWYTRDEQGDHRDELGHGKAWESHQTAILDGKLIPTESPGEYVVEGTCTITASHDASDHFVWLDLHGREHTCDTSRHDNPPGFVSASNCSATVVVTPGIDVAGVHLDPSYMVSFVILGETTGAASASADCPNGGGTPPVFVVEVGSAGICTGRRSADQRYLSSLADEHDCPAQDDIIDAKNWTKSATYWEMLLPN